MRSERDPVSGANLFVGLDFRRLEAGSHSERERDEILDELSAAVLHLHVHTKGLNEYLCETAPADISMATNKVTFVRHPIPSP